MRKKYVLLILKVLDIYIQDTLLLMKNIKSHVYMGQVDLDNFFKNNYFTGDKL
jgi:hypothetical protein